MINHDSLYSKSDKAHYIVLIESNHFSIGKLHPMNIGKMLFQYKVEGVINIKGKSINWVGAEINSAQADNYFVENNEFNIIDYEITIPLMMTTCKGVVNDIGVNTVNVGTVEKKEQVKTTTQKRIARTRQSAYTVKNNS
ncbi:hypothetical protein WA026_019812 [Henosepilachna vigintioctopunctata]|uniref:Uncharacterized protein n=1 Tax=Henosepilachna vigintioctopunctata TaxID=420089 RepID=A0AAW1VFR5_9CUCU